VESVHINSSPIGCLSNGVPYTLIQVKNSRMNGGQVQVKDSDFYVPVVSSPIAYSTKFPTHAVNAPSNPKTIGSHKNGVSWGLTVINHFLMNGAVGLTENWYFYVIVDNPLKPRFKTSIPTQKHAGSARRGQKSIGYLNTGAHYNLIQISPYLKVGVRGFKPN